jgi:ABC-type multidrug transport system fused ATPase/permease subunit
VLAQEGKYYIKKLHNQQIALIAEYENTVLVSTTVHSNADLIKRGAPLRSLWRASKIYCAKKMTNLLVYQLNFG